MSFNDIEMMNPDTLTKDMENAIFSEMFGEDGLGSDRRDNRNAEVGTESDEDRDDGDIPNAKIRLDKLKQQRDEERNKRSELEKRLAQLEGKLSVLDKKDSDAQEVDPSEYMDDTQKFLYNENQQLKNTINKLTEVVQGIQTEGSKNKLQKQEESFFESNPELKQNKEEFIEDILGYLNDKPTVKQMLKNGEMNLFEVYGMYKAGNPKSSKTAQVSNPDRLFSGHSKSVPAARTQDSNSELASKKALQILRDRESTNKGQAAKHIQDQIVGDILSFLD